MRKGKSSQGSATPFNSRQRIVSKRRLPAGVKEIHPPRRLVVRGA